MSDSLPTGAYDRLLTDHLHQALVGRTTEVAISDPADTPTLLGAQLARALTAALQDLPDDERVAKANEVLTLLGLDERVLPGPRVLELVAPLEDPATLRRLRTRPRVPLAQPALLTGAGRDPKLGDE